MTFHIITLFPQSFDSYLGESILKRAIEDKKIKVKFYNPRDFSKNKFRHIDQRPFDILISDLTGVDLVW
jgi:tRNA (guanine37-N1)-methyltransferase